MKTYSEFSPTKLDQKGLNCEDEQDWLVLPCSQNRDSDALDRSNFRVAEKMLAKADPKGEDYSVKRFSHWACGWFEILMVRPDTQAHQVAKTIEEKIDNYPVLDENDSTVLEQEEALLTWQNCFSDKERLAYIRDNREQFEFHDYMQLIHNVRGKDFCGYASELIY